MNKEIIIGEDAKKLIKNVVVKLCDAVGMTLGPKGNNAIIDTDYSDPFVTNDGVTIAKNIEFDISEEVIAKIIKEACIKTCDNVGDGTTTSLVLLKSIYLESINYVNNRINPLIVKESLENESKKVISKILNMSKKVSLKEIENIAAISSGSKTIGNIIKVAIESVSEDGVILLEESDKEESSLELINGMYLDTGAVSSYMIKDRLKEEIINDVYVLVTDAKINDINEISNIISLVKKESKNLLIIADDYEDAVIEEIINYKTSNTLNIICVKAPNYSENKKDILEDICIYTNSTFISSKYNRELVNVSLNDLGNTSEIKVTNENIIIYKNVCINEKVNERIDYIKSLIPISNPFEREILEMRLSNLSNGVAIIHAGGKTHAEMILNKMRIEDAIHAAKVSIDYGYSLGGGLTFHKISDTLLEKEIGAKILNNSLKSVFKQIVENSGYEYNRIVKELQNKNEYIGFDASNNKIVDLSASGIIDPTKVLIEAFKNAVSISNMLLTTSLIVVTKNKKLNNNITEVI